MRAGILSRFSTDKQRDTSCDDQIRVCRSRVDKDGWSVVATYRDEGVSGSTPVNRRPDGARMLADALAGRFDVLLMEGLDRLSRDMVEQERIVRRLEHQGIRIIGVSDGYDSTSSARKLHRGMRGIINEVYLDDLRAKTHRGLAGQFDRGLFAGGMSYGYRSVEVANGHQLEIDENEAKWVRWIFEQYANGQSPRSLAHELNKQGVPSPRGGTWAVSALYGSPVKGTGILNNELYVGRYIWNRSQWIKDPDTGTRKRVERPKTEWRIVNRPDLKIVSDELWATVRAKLKTPSLRGGNTRRPKTLLGGVLRCGICGGAVVCVNGFRYGCAAHHDRGNTVCTGMYIRRDTTESRILSAVRDIFLSPESLTIIQENARQVMQEQTRDTAAASETSHARLPELEREIRNLTDAVACAGWSQSLSERLAEKETERSRLRQRANAPRSKTEEIPAVIARYKKMLMDLPGTLERNPERAKNAFQEHFGEIPLIQEGDKIYAELRIPASRVLLAAGGDVYINGSGGRI